MTKLQEQKLRKLIQQEASKLLKETHNTIDYEAMDEVDESFINLLNALKKFEANFSIPDYDGNAALQKRRLTTLVSNISNEMDAWKSWKGENQV